jgi:mono/diheme cytochrome c family protein
MRQAMVLSIVLVSCSAAVSSRAGEGPDAEAAQAGAVLFKVHCASCHGDSGRGDGKAAPALEFAPPDLTRISERNKGKFPFDRVVQIVDGRKPMKGHVRSAMPVWGDVLLTQREGYDHAKVKEQIRRLVHYVASIQTPPPAEKPATN